MSLDGFVAGPDDGPDLPLGAGGERLHEWVYGLASWREAHGMAGGERSRDGEIVEESIADTGAVVVGRRMFENAGGWGDEPPFHRPVFVLTSTPREPLVRAGGTTFTFVDGVEKALGRAREVAAGQDVMVGGGARTIQQFLAAGLLDEIQVHVAPLLLGGGVPLFVRDGGPQLDLRTTRVVESPAVTHLRFEIVR
jgi:dihydrofolate reductase